MTPEQARAALAKLPGWALEEGGKSIAKEFALSGFTAAADFIRAIAPAANAMDHHPDLHLTRYRRVRVVLSTHSAGGLTDKDFELAAKIDALPKDEKA